MIPTAVRRILLNIFVVLFNASYSCFAQLHFVSMQAGGDNSAIGYKAIGPAFDVYLRDLQKDYPVTMQDYNYTCTQQNTPGSCTSFEADGVVEALTRLYNSGLLKERPTIISGVFCPTSFAAIGDFARELNFLALACHLDDGTYANREHYPSTISFSPAVSSSVADTLFSVLLKFSWKSIAVIRDSLSKNPRFSRSTEMCRAVLELLFVKKDQVQLLVIPTDSTLQPANTDQALLAASKFSRIILSCTLVDAQRQLLATATDLGMTNGDYVFMHLYALDVPGDRALYWQGNDSLDQKVAAALLTTLVVRTEVVPWSRIRDTMDAISKTRFQQFGIPVSSAYSQANDFLPACAEALQASVMTINASWHPDNKTWAGGVVVARGMLNRTFNLPLRPVRITGQGIRVVTTVVQQYSPQEGEFKTLFSQDSEIALLLSSSSHPVWVGGSVPLDRPRCGLDGHLCQKSDVLMTALVTALVFCVVIVVLVLSARYSIVQGRHVNTWWKADDTLLEFKSNQRRSVISQASGMAVNHTHTQTALAV